MLHVWKFYLHLPQTWPKYKLVPPSATSGALQPVEAKKKAAPNALSEDVGLSKGKRIVGWIGLAKKN